MFLSSVWLSEIKLINIMEFVIPWIPWNYPILQYFYFVVNLRNCNYYLLIYLLQIEYTILCFLFFQSPILAPPHQSTPSSPISLNDHSPIEVICGASFNNHPMGRAEELELAEVKEEEIEMEYEYVKRGKKYNLRRKDRISVL